MARRLSGKARRAKGARAEREFFALLNRYLPERLRFERNLNQSRDGGADGSGPDFVSIEVKRQERLSIGAWLKQARAQCVNGSTPVVAYRQNNDKWHCLVEMDATQFAAFLRCYHNIGDTARTIKTAGELLP